MGHGGSGGGGDVPVCACVCACACVHCAKIHAVVTSVSPMKCSASGRTNYFDG